MQKSKSNMMTLDEIISRLESVENKIILHEDRLAAVEDISHTNSIDINDVKKSVNDVEAQIDKLRRARYMELCHVFGISIMVFFVVFLLFKLFDL